MNTTASSDEKMMAALVHGSVLLMFLGPIVPVILWASQRTKSKYVSFHALQTMGYQALLFWLWIAVMILVTIGTIFLIPLSGVLLQSSPDTPFFPFLFQIPIFGAIFGLMGLSFLTGLAGAVLCLLGRDFRYPFLGRWLECYLSYNDDPGTSLSEAQEDNWVASVCHATAILQLWGVVTPLIVWFSQRERSPRLRFQSLQAAVYQFMALAVYMLGMAVYMAVFLGMFILLALAGTMGGNPIEGPPAVLMLIFFGLIMLFWFLIMVLMPVYYLLAALAGVRVLRGRPFRYPLLGRLIESRIGVSLPTEAPS
jgi:uncharacterized Tic20 family protein